MLGLSGRYEGLKNKVLLCRYIFACGSKTSTRGMRAKVPVMA